MASYIHIRYKPGWLHTYIYAISQDGFIHIRYKPGWLDTYIYAICQDGFMHTYTL